MKRLVLALLLGAAACDTYAPPIIDSFTVDDANPPLGASVHLKFSVRDAAIISIVPEPGEVTASPVLVRPRGPTTYTLRAGNVTGWVQKDLLVNAHVLGGASAGQFSVVPSQAPAGTPRKLSWQVNNGVVVSVGVLGSELVAVAPSGEMTVKPDATTVYALSATSATGFNSMAWRTVARVVPPTAISSFTASPPAILQGEKSTLSWEGTALSWMVSANGVDTHLGVAKSLAVRPAASTTYTLTGAGPSGTATLPVTVTVTPRAATALSYTPPPSAPGPLVLRADPCPPLQCTALTMRLFAVGTANLRGLALDLPLDSTKVSLDPATFSTALDTGKAVLGTGPLRDTLVLGAAKKGTGAAPAPDSAFADSEVAHFTVTLKPEGGQGPIFDGNAPFKAYLQSAAGRTPGGIAVGQLTAVGPP